MERVYLLLRNNQQTGPFTIGELLQQQLKPSDMIWVEGKSAAWTYLTELELAPHMHHEEESKQEVQLKNEDEIERKAEELRQRVLASTPKTYFPKYTTEIETYASPYNRSEEDIQFVDHRKERIAKRSAVFGEFFLTCVVIGLFILGIYKGKSFLGVRDGVQPSVATQLDSGDQHAAQKPKPVSPQSTTVAMDTVAIQPNDSLLAVERAAQKAAAARRHLIDSTLKAKEANALAAGQNKKEDSEPAPPKPVELPIVKEETVKKEITQTTAEVKPKAEPVKEEKKGFLRGLFKKKKNANPEKEGESKQ